MTCETNLAAVNYFLFTVLACLPVAANCIDGCDVNGAGHCDGCSRGFGLTSGNTACKCMYTMVLSVVKVPLLQCNIHFRQKLNLFSRNCNNTFSFYKYLEALHIYG